MVSDTGDTFLGQDPEAAISGVKSKNHASAMGTMAQTLALNYSHVTGKGPSIRSIAVPKKSRWEDCHAAQQDIRRRTRGSRRLLWLDGFSDDAAA
jgi:hypothetical protein